MKCQTAILFIALVFAGCSSREADPLVEKQRLLDLETEAIAREFKNDTAFLSSVMDTTFIELSKDTIKDKHEVLRTIYANNMENSKNGSTVDSFVLEHPVVHLYGNTAVVTFIMHTFRRKESLERRTRFYDVWVKRDNKWMAVSWQASSVE